MRNRSLIEVLREKTKLDESQVTLLYEDLLKRNAAELKKWAETGEDEPILPEMKSTPDFRYYEGLDEKVIESFPAPKFSLRIDRKI